MYIKVFDISNNIINVEQIDFPRYVYWTPNGTLTGCPKELAQGIVSENGDNIYLKEGVFPHGIPEPYFKEINKHEYFQIKSQEEDIEDIKPIISESSETLPMSREELTAKIAELEAANKALFDLIESLQQKEK